MKNLAKAHNIKNKKLRLKKSFFKRNYDNYYTRLRRLKVLNYLQNELETSATHGLPYTVDQNIHGSERIFWTASFVICCALAILLLNVQYTRFIAAPTVMSVEMNYFDWNISFPAITLCPLYKPDIIKYGTFISKTNNETGLRVGPFMWAITGVALDTIQYMDLDISEDILALIHPENYTTVASSMFRNFGDNLLTINRNRTISVEAAMTEMGMCHVINSNVAKYDNPRKWNEMSAYVKNNVELSVFEVDFYAQLTNYAPVYKVFIHSPDEITTSTTSTFTFDVEGSIIFGLSVWSSRISEELRYKSIRLRKCRFIDEPTSERYPIYSYSHCVMECRIKMIKKLCGCIPHFYKPLKDERICHFTELKCVRNYRKEIISLRASEDTLKKFNYAKDLPRTSSDCDCLSTCDLDLYYKDNEDYIANTKLNQLKIKITSFPKVRVVRDIIFNAYDILLRSGGVVNLCIGSSIISIMEFILVVIKVSIYLLTWAFRTLCIPLEFTFRKMKKTKIFLYK